MTRSVFRYANWTIAADMSEDASPPTFAMACVDCAEQSPVSENAGDVQDWALKHSGLNPGHRSFRGLHTSLWRTAPANESEAPAAAWIGRQDAAPIIPEGTQ